MRRLAAIWGCVFQHYCRDVRLLIILSGRFDPGSDRMNWIFRYVKPKMTEICCFSVEDWESVPIRRRIAVAQPEAAVQFSVPDR